MNHGRIHDWTGENGIAGKYFYLRASIVNREMKLPIISKPSPVRDIMTSEAPYLIESIRTVVPNTDFILFGRGIYSNALMLRLCSLPVR